jgi:hypothetical protein
MCVVGAVCWAELAGIPAETCCREYCDYYTSKNVTVHFVGCLCLLHGRWNMSEMFVCCEGTVLIPDSSDKGYYKWPDSVDSSLILSDAVSPGK